MDDRYLIHFPPRCKGNLKCDKAICQDIVRLMAVRLAARQPSNSTDENYLSIEHGGCNFKLSHHQYIPSIKEINPICEFIGNNGTVLMPGEELCTSVFIQQGGNYSISAISSSSQSIYFPWLLLFFLFWLK